MTPPDLSPAEAATVARFDAAEPAPESWGGDGLREVVARTMYEADRAHNGDSDGPAWDHDLLGLLGLRDAYRVSADAVLALPELAALRAKAAAVDRVRERVDAIDADDCYLNMITTAMVRHLLDGPPC